MKLIQTTTTAAAADLNVDQFKNNSSGEFSRIEDKYLVRVDDLNTVLKSLYTHMDPSYLDDGTQFTLIESLYFDSENLDFYKHHFMDLTSRYKLRTRRYAPNGIWSNGPVQVELKAKNLGVCKKTRFQVSQAVFEKLKNGEKIEFNHELMLLNLNMKEETLLKRVEKVNSLINTLKLKPKMQVVYHRLAFQKDNFRATIDSNIQFNSINAVNSEFASSMKSSDLWRSAQNLLAKFKQEQFVVLELKHTEEIPAWIKTMLLETQIKKTGFSKYGWSISDIISRM